MNKLIRIIFLINFYAFGFSKTPQKFRIVWDTAIMGGGILNTLVNLVLYLVNRILGFNLIPMDFFLYYSYFMFIILVILVRIKISKLTEKGIIFNKNVSEMKLHTMFDLVLYFLAWITVISLMGCSGYIAFH